MSNTSKSSVEKLRAAYRATFAIAILFLFLGGFFLFVGTSLKNDPRSEDALIAGIIVILAGIMYLILGVFVRRKSSVALAIAVGFMALNVLLAFDNLIKKGNPAGFFLPVIYISQAWEGFAAIKALKEEQKS